MTLTVTYAVDKYRVNIDLDLNGDIIGVVTVNDEEYTFIKPAYSLASTTGLSVSEEAMTDVGKITNLLITELMLVQHHQPK
jgi:uncharacterized protein YuzE